MIMLRVGLDFTSFFKHFFLFSLDSETVALTFSKLNGSVWHDTAIPFKQVVEEFEAWLAKHGLWAKDRDWGLNDAAFVTW